MPDQRDRDHVGSLSCSLIDFESLWLESCVIMSDLRNIFSVIIYYSKKF